MPRTSAVPIQAKPAMPAKTVFRPVEAANFPGLFVDNSFEENLLRELSSFPPARVNLSGAPLSAKLGAPINPRWASSDSDHEGCPEGHPSGRLMIRNEIICGGAPTVVESNRIFAVCEGTTYRILGVTTKEAAYAVLGIAAPKPQVFEVERFMSLLRTMFVYAVVRGKVYRVVSFVSLDERSQLAQH